MTPNEKRSAILIATGAVIIAGLCLFFPRMLAFVELAARELRYLWWLVLLVALAVWLIFFVGRKKE